MHRGHISRHKKIQPEKIITEGVAFKDSLNHTSETPKSGFFSISYFEKCFYIQSLPIANLV